MVTIDKWASTSGQDNYTLKRSSSNPTIVVLTHAHGTTTTTANFSPGNLPSAIFALGQGGDTMTIDYSNGDPLTSMNLSIQGTFGANNKVYIVGSGDDESFTVSRWDATVTDGTYTSTFNIGDVSVYVDDGGGDDDELILTGNEREGATVYLDDSRFFSVIDIGEKSELIMQPNSAHVLTVATLTIDATAFLDLADNDLILDYTGSSQYTAIQSLIAAARNGGDWESNGITSFSARTASPANKTLGVLEATEYKAIYGTNAQFAGQTIDNSAVLVRYTYYGDTEFNGIINFDDYSRTDSGYNTPKTGWLNGDFDGSGVVNFDDYALIDLAFNTQTGTLYSGGPGGGNPNLIALGQMEHFTQAYMWFFIDWNIDNHGIYYTPEDFFPDGEPW